MTSKAYFISLLLQINRNIHYYIKIKKKTYSCIIIIFRDSYKNFSPNVSVLDSWFTVSLTTYLVNQVKISQSKLNIIDTKKVALSLMTLTYFIN